MTVFGGITCEPLELETLLPVCRQVGRTELYDGITEERRFTDVLLAFRPDSDGAYRLSHPGAGDGGVYQADKEGVPGLHCNRGGVHAQLNYRRLCWPGVDYVFRTESADWFRGLLEALDRGRCPEGFWTVPQGGRQVCGDTLRALRHRHFPGRTGSGWAERADWFRYLDFARLSTLKTAVSCPFRDASSAMDETSTADGIIPAGWSLSWRSWRRYRGTRYYRGLRLPAGGDPAWRLSPGRTGGAGHPKNIFVLRAGGFYRRTSGADSPAVPVWIPASSW